MPGSVVRSTGWVVSTLLQWRPMSVLLACSALVEYSRFVANPVAVKNAYGIRLGAKVLGTLVLEYRFCSTRRYSVLILLKSTCTRTQVLLKIKVLLTSTYEY